MNVEKLRELFEKSTDKYGDAEKNGTTDQTMYNIIYKGNICKVDLVQKIANFFKVPVGYFFDVLNVSINPKGKEPVSTGRLLSIIESPQGTIKSFYITQKRPIDTPFQDAQI